MADRDEWELAQLLAEPARRRVYDAVRAARGPMTREAVAEAAQVSRRLAAFHLDVLADAGLLTFDFARPAGRSGPGAGRPAKRYTATAVEVDLSMPPRRYDVAARILARAVDSAPTDARTAAHDVARDEGQRIGTLHRGPRRLKAGESLGAVEPVLTGVGYEPRRDGSSVRLGNCPFRAVADVAPGLVCSLNQQFVSGVLDGLGAHRSLCADLDVAPPDCCVVLRRR